MSCTQRLQWDIGHGTQDNIWPGDFHLTRPMSLVFYCSEMVSWHMSVGGWQWEARYLCAELILHMLWLLFHVTRRYKCHMWFVDMMHIQYIRHVTKNKPPFLFNQHDCHIRAPRGIAEPITNPPWITYPETRPLPKQCDPVLMAFYMGLLLLAFRPYHSLHNIRYPRLYWVSKAKLTPRTQWVVKWFYKSLTYFGPFFLRGSMFL